MIIPKKESQLCKFLKFIIDTSMQSREDRQNMYARRSRYYLYGSNQIGPALHNKLNSQLGLVSSFIYSPDHAKYSIAPKAHSDDDEVLKMMALSRYWNQTFLDSDLAYQYEEALRWSLTFDTMYLKLGWNDAREELFGHIVPPGQLCVYDEAKQGLDNQSAFVHSYSIDFDEAVQRLYRAGLSSEIKRLKRNEGQDDADIPPLLQSIVMGGAWGPSITDNLQGVVNTSAEPIPSYQAVSVNPTVKWHEVWVWDDQYNDYSIFTVIDPDIVLSDSRETIEIIKSAPKSSKVQPASMCNIFLPDEHPFIEIQPYGKYDYYWGEALIEKLIPLQNWSEKRLGEIQMLLAKQVRPPKFADGVGGLSDETMSAMEGPAAWAFLEMPGAKIQELKPEIPPDLFAELKEIDRLFNEQCGLTEVVQGKGEEGVRGRGHAKQLATTGSGRIRKVAVGLEKSLGKLGDVGLKLLMRNSEERIRTATKMDFIAAQASADFHVRIAGHSHSPLFRDETKEDAVVMRKIGAIDNEDVIDIINPPNAEEYKFKLRKRQAMQAAMAQAQAQNGEPPKAGGKPNLKVVGQ